MINKVILIGRLTANPELRYTSSGIGVATFTLAVDRTFKNKQGEKETDFINIVVWRQLSELCVQYLVKGQQAAVEGRISTRNYENKQGQKVYVTEVVADNVQFLGGKKEGSEMKWVEKNDDPFDGQTIEITDEDLPF